MRTLACIAVVSGLWLVIAPPVQTQARCSCTGQSADRHEGGNGAPLRWSSLMRQVGSNPRTGPEYCYERSVDNQSDRDVTNVYWEVAGIERPYLEKHQPICDATSMTGVFKSPDPAGPLNFNTGTQSYSTTVYSPSSGWAGQTAAPNAPNVPPLTSTMQIPIKGAGIATVTLTSSLRTEGNTHIFTYELSNAGPAIRVFWNVPVTDDFRSLEFLPNSPITVPPAGRVTREAKSLDPVGVAVADVHVYAADLTWLGSGVASAYASTKGARQTPRPRPGRGGAR
jgi:hypothetical protein